MAALKGTAIIGSKELEVIQRILRSNVALTGFALAILGVLIFGGAIALNSGKTNGEATAILTDIGAIPVTLTELNQQTIDHGLFFYWLGERADSFMTINHESPGVVILSYDSNAEEGSTVDTPDISVATYPDEAGYTEAMVGAVHVAPDIVVSNSRGDVVTINADVLSEMAVKIRGTSTVVRLLYEKKQTEASLIADSERLVEFEAF